MRSAVTGCALMLAGCRGVAASTLATPPVAHETVDSPVSDEALFRRWWDAVAVQLEADAQSGATRRFASADEVTPYLVSLTPAGFRPRPQYFASIASPGDVETLARRVAGYAKDHPVDADRVAAAFAARIAPSVQQAIANIHSQFPTPTAPPQTPVTGDPFEALAEARRRGRSTLVVFAAEWCAACREVDRSLASAAVQKALAEGFVAVRVDVTDADAPAVQKAEETLHVRGLPTLLVFDRAGHEVARAEEFVDPSRLVALLGRAR